MSQAAGGPVDPSMEDILASIRRILNEDELAPAPVAGPLPGMLPGPLPTSVTEPLALTEAMLVPEDAPPSDPFAELAAPGPLAPEPAVAAPPVTEAPIPVPDPPEVHVAHPAAEPDPSETLVASPPPQGAVPTVGALLRAAMAERSVAVTRSGPSFEDMVREEMRPLLREWMDRNLPTVIERLARAEIERVVGRALS